MRAVMLLVRLSEADQTADRLTVVAVELQRFFMMLAAATGNALIRPELIARRHHFVSLRSRLTLMMPSCVHTTTSNSREFPFRNLRNAEFQFLFEIFLKNIRCAFCSFYYAA